MHLRVFEAMKNETRSLIYCCTRTGAKERIVATCHQGLRRLRTHPGRYAELDLFDCGLFRLDVPYGSST
jgi:hypothetical protein